MSRPLRQLAGRLTYANVTATIALLISLGGASYAAVELPARSVGSEQLKPRAVTLGKLAFPLGAAGTTDPTREDLQKDGCDAPLPPGQVLTIDCAQQIAYGSTLPRLADAREQTLRLSGTGPMLISGTAGLYDEGPADTTATVTAALAVDGVVIAHPRLDLSGQSAAELPLDAVLSVGAGVHRVAVGFAVRYSSDLPGDVVVSPVTLLAVTIPHS